MFTFNRNEQIAILVLIALLIIGSVVSSIDYFWPSHVEDFEVRKAAVPVPEIQEVDESHTRTPERIDVNSASPRELTNLPQIGPKTAERIVAHRTANGPFKKVEDLMAIRGIGTKTIEKLRPLVKVDSP